MKTILLSLPLLVSANPPLSSSLRPDPGPDGESNVHWTDLDGDGRADCVLLVDGRLTVLGDLGQGVFEERAAHLEGALEPARQLLATDVDADGDDDFVLVGRSGKLTFLRGSGADGLLVATAEVGLEGARAERVFADDWDADGWTDLLLTSAGRVELLRGGAAGFAPVELPVFAVEGVAPVAISGPATLPESERESAVQSDRAGAEAVSPATGDGASRIVLEEASPVWSPTPGGTAAAGALCAPTLRDAASGSCLGASSEPALGSLYPISEAIYVDPSENRIGIRTTTPRVNGLHVAGDYYGKGHMYLHAFEGDGNSGTAYLQARDLSGTSTVDLQLRTQSAGTYKDLMRLTGSGRVGIGTTTPSATLQVEHGESSLSAISARATGNNQALRAEATSSSSTNPAMYVGSAANAFGMLVESTHADKRAGGFVGRVEVANSTVFGLLNPRITLNPDDGGAGRIDVMSEASLRTVGIDGDWVDGGRIDLYNPSGVSTVRLLAAQSLTDSSPILQLTNASGATEILLDADYLGSGKSRVIADVVEIRGGADLAESFETGGEALEPGTVVVIDAEREGELRTSNGAYDRAVAGIVSGAGGVDAGLHLGQRGLMEGSTPVALTGRVYVRASAENGPIRPGDLLTTAATAGHAMRATDAARTPGAVLGKAMGSLDEGTGLVLVLVGLQ